MNLNQAGICFSLNRKVICGSETELRAFALRDPCVICAWHMQLHHRLHRKWKDRIRPWYDVIVAAAALSFA